MREIKFRAWNGREMITPTAIINGKAAINKPCDINDKVLTDEEGVNYYCNWDIDKTTDYPLMQFIGLKDKNGVDIYEDDIDSHLRVFTYNVEMGGWYLMSNGEGIQWHEQVVKNGRLPFEVIGNRHQNPELLESR